MTRVSFTIPGKPYAKKRPRFSRKIGRAFDPKENSDFEGTVGHLARPHFPAPMEGPVRLFIHIVFAAPASWSRKKRDAMLHRPHTQKPDVDNLGKAVADGLNRIAWADDAQVYELSVCKFWGVTDQTVVHVEPYSGAQP